MLLDSCTFLTDELKLFFQDSVLSNDTITKTHKFCYTEVVAVNHRTPKLHVSTGAAEFKL